jgi:hypothetical protein
MHNSHIPKKENGKNYDDADEFLIEKEHLILSIRIRWEKGKLFSGGNIPSPNEFFDKIFFFFSLQMQELLYHNKRDDFWEVHDLHFAITP